MTKSLTLQEIGHKLEAIYDLLGNPIEPTLINVEILLDTLIGCLEEPEFLRISPDPAEILSLISAFKVIKTNLPQFKLHSQIALYKNLCKSIKEFYMALLY